jgi:2-polyprenyl-3-methyl-5-hydroxy-6-metoxy-1,4-benzoquinol methylase
MIVDYANFHERAERAKYIFEKFQKYFGKKVLDVGCDKAILRTLAREVEYTGIDVGGNPDIVLNLEKVEHLPFEDDAFDCVVCSDVLEHLDNLHSMFFELIRVTKRYVIVSWPNAWSAARLPIQQGIGSFKHYGLPVEKTADRHKWFFNITEAINFVHYNTAKRGDLELVEERITDKPRPVVLQMMRRLIYPHHLNYLNRYAHTLWTVLKKNMHH